MIPRANSGGGSRLARGEPLSAVLPRWRIGAPWYPSPGAVARLAAPGLLAGPAERLAVAPVMVPRADDVRCTPLRVGPAQSISIPRISPHEPRPLRPNPYGEFGDDGGDHPGHPAAGSTPDIGVLLAALLRPPLPRLVAPEGALDWPHPLLDYQKEGIAALVERPNLLLADEMGLGKTIQAIGALRILALRGDLRSALVVCPASLVRQWMGELRRWAPELVAVSMVAQAADRAALWLGGAHVRVISYESLRIDVLDLRDSPALRQEWDVVVLDEASRIKNAQTDIARACKALPARRRWALTGTPMENRLSDTASILAFLSGSSLGGAGWSADTVAVRSELRRVQLRRKKEDVQADLPPKRIIVRELDLPDAQRESYNRAERSGIVWLRDAGRAATVTHVLELIVRLKQLCNVDPSSGQSAKMADIAARVADLMDEDRRALVFSQFTDGVFGVEWVAHQLRAHHPLTYVGSLSSAARDAVLRRFATDPTHRVLILSLRAGGFGLNLQAASYVFHLDRWWNPAVEDQAEARAHRMGQPLAVTAYRYLCRGTIEERIDRKLREKRELFSEVIDDVTLDLGAALSEAELFGLFGLESPDRSRPSVAT